MALDATATEHTHARICPLCEACCGLEIRTQTTPEGSSVISIRGNEADPFSHGYLCPKGVALKDLHEDPDRLRQPMRRRADRAGFEPVSWDEAFAEVARRLPPLCEQYGADAVALTIGNPASHKIGLFSYFPHLARALGTRNLFSASTLDQMPKQLACGLMYGHWLSVPVPDLPRTDLFICLGANPMVSNGSLWTSPDYRGKAKAMRARGGRIVVIDPRRTETAQAADEHLAIRPGGDVYLLLGLLHTVFEEGLERLGRLEAHVEGLDALRAAVADFPPERGAAHCGIPAETQRRLAREFATTPKAVLYGRFGTCTQRFGSLNSWLIDALNIVTGHFDTEGGLMFPKAAAFAANTLGRPGQGKGVATGRRHSRVGKAPEVMGEFPISCLAEEIETPGDGQVHALITVACNPVLSSPNGARLARALDGLDFMLSLDPYINETSRHADLILPPPSPLEDWHYDMVFAQLSWRNHARWSGPVLRVDADAPDAPRAEWQTLLRLAAIASGLPVDADLQAVDDAALRAELKRQAGDQAEAVFGVLEGGAGPARWLDLGLRSGPYGDGFGAKPDGLTLAKVKAAPHGIDLGELQPRVPEILRTSSGRIDLAPSALLADLAHADAALRHPTGDELLLIGRRETRSNNSWMHNLPVLAKGRERCTLLVHPDDAARAGLVEGQSARLSNARGSVIAPVTLSPDMRPGVVSLPHGWGHDLSGSQLNVAARHPGVNMNLLLDEEARDPVSGTSVLSGIPVRLSAAEA
ncbi:anaerobic selenocysteine-containing dehydrogenase [Mitsuaria sp. BK045]|uniref:molybdopterin-dependent oxidoreductase n=1 Tax=unclassified Roseateles TaxID=2626991 RepID=UPI0016189394|nr:MULTISPECIES: molybdopterin-dependent oxidoreductase [unclassified Roseateles]MBB3291579.1 anaerobic selenocysteine-containing dehydrogenase [Mitsuaria sp. BK041]MBB3360796.1 anaerobic selenocysteine-containing dehydrogenase [Mitsuaria sp. BK045]